jgi:hypothetical protein
MFPYRIQPTNIAVRGQIGSSSPVADLSDSYLGSNANNTLATTYTMMMPIGDTHPNKLITVVMETQTNAVNHASMTIDGMVAQRRSQAPAAGATVCISLWTLAATNTGNVPITVTVDDGAGGSIKTARCILRTYAFNRSFVAADIDTVSPMSITITNATDGLVLMSTQTANGTLNPSVTFTNGISGLYNSEATGPTLFSAGGIGYDVGTYPVQAQWNIGTPQRMIVATYGAKY